MMRGNEALETLTLWRAEPRVKGRRLIRGRSEEGGEA
jgi:hypothetical protein